MISIIDVLLFIVIRAIGCADRPHLKWIHGPRKGRSVGLRLSFSTRTKISVASLAVPASSLVKIRNSMSISESVGHWSVLGASPSAEERVEIEIDSVVAIGLPVGEHRVTDQSPSIPASQISRE
jgi:hypothetical protein